MGEPTVSGLSLSQMEAVLEAGDTINIIDSLFGEDVEVGVAYVNPPSNWPDFEPCTLSSNFSDESGRNTSGDRAGLG